MKSLLLLGNLLVYARFPGQVRRFYRRLGYLPNVCDPRTKNEKFLWRKIFDRNPAYRVVTDKLTVRPFVAERCPGLAMSEIMWSGRSPAEMPDAWLRPGYVIKTNNGSSRNIFIQDGKVDRAAIEQILRTWLASPYAVRAGQWCYGGIDPRILIERRIGAANDPDFVDISCHTLMGHCVLVTVDRDVKLATERIAVFDANGNRLKLRFIDTARQIVQAELPDDYPLPPTFWQAIRDAEAIARDFDYIRVDFMSTGTQLYFCECTVFPMGGFSVISGGADDRINAAWDLRKSWFLRTPHAGLKGWYSRFYRRCLDAGYSS